MPTQIKTAVETKDAPQAIGPYSQAIVSGGFLYCSGQIPLDPKSGEMITGGIEEQAKRVLENLQNLVRAAGSDLSQVVKTTIFLTDLSHFAKVNELYGKYFQKPFPARSTIQVAALPKGAAIEIEAIAKVL